MVPLHLLTDTRQRGAQRFAVDLAQELGRIGVQQRTVALEGSVGAASLDLPVLGPRRLALSTLSHLREEVNSASMAIGFGSTTLPALALATRGLKTPLVYRSIGEISHWAGSRRRKTTTRMFLSRMSGVVALWDLAADALEADFGVSRERIHVIPRGVPKGRFAPPTSEERTIHRAALDVSGPEPVICWVGALSEEKDPLRAIRAVEAVPDARLLIAGRGPMEDEVTKLVSALDGRRFKMLGEVADVASVYRAADLVLLTSVTEGMPGVLIEAGLCGVPAVATAVGAAPEMLEGGAGCIVGRHADAGEVAAALLQTLESREDLSVKALRRCTERYEIRSVAERWLHMLDAVDPEWSASC